MRYIMYSKFAHLFQYAIYITHILFFCVQMAFPSCLVHASDQDATASEKEVWLTIFVHGIMSIKHHLSVENIMRFICDDVRNCLYEKTVAIMRSDPFFFRNQAMQEIGLRRIPDVGVTGISNSAGLMAELFDCLYGNNGCSSKTETYYYTFGWSGLLSANARYEDAVVFFNAISNEVSRFKDKKIIPKIRIIAYSHGGNVSLNLAAVRSAHHNIPDFKIDELFLVGIPVQQETDYLINDPIFKAIYNLYSKSDRIQRLDPFSSKSFLSKRIFTQRPDLSLPSKLKQIEIQATRCSMRLKRKECNKKAVHIMDRYGIASGKSRLLRTVSPGHAELWFFGWTPFNYRKNFPLYPFPSIAIIPYITRYFTSKDSLDCSINPCVFDVRPEFEQIVVKIDGQVDTISFLKQVNFEYMKKKLISVAGRRASNSVYIMRINSAFERAQEWQNAEDIMHYGLPDE